MLTAPLAAAIARSVRERIEICELDLSGWIVLTEAATGSYAVTAAAAATAGAEVFAIAAETSYGSAADARTDVETLMHSLEAPSDRVLVVTDKSRLPVEAASLVTNSGVLRPIDGPLIERLPRTASIALMYEAWEARLGDIDYAAAGRRGIPVVGVNEHHPACGAFEFVGDLVVAAALQRGWPLRGRRVGVLSDNAFAGPVERTLGALGVAVVSVDPSEFADVAPRERWDLAVVATTPERSASAAGGAVPATHVTDIVAASGAYGCIQLWGDVDRKRLRAASVLLEPERDPEVGHQGIAMSNAGYEAVVRLQVGGLAAVFHRDVEPGDRLYGLSQPVTIAGDWG